MDPAMAVAIVGAVVVVAVIVYFVMARRHPENASRHIADTWADDTRADATGRGMLPGDVHERPAGPGAEAQGVDGPGHIEPGPPGPPAGRNT